MSAAARVKATETACLAIDLGAGSGRVVLGRISGGCWNLQEVGRFHTPTRIDATYGYQCWDTDAIQRRIDQHIGEARKQSTLASVAVDSWGVDYVLLDENLSPIGVPVCYRDKRTEGVMEQLQR